MQIHTIQIQLREIRIDNQPHTIGSIVQIHLRKIVLNPAQNPPPSYLTI